MASQMMRSTDPMCILTSVSITAYERRLVAIAKYLSWSATYREAYPGVTVTGPLCAMPALFPEIWK
jgi:hypothetical protein